MSQNQYKPDADQDPGNQDGTTADAKDLEQDQGQEQDMKADDAN